MSKTNLRGERNTIFSAKRKPKINKYLIFSDLSMAASTQTGTLLYTATYPCTLAGLRWDGVFLNTSATGDTVATWAITIERDNVATSTMAQSDAASFYQPEQDVMTFGVLVGTDRDGGTGPGYMKIGGNVKTKRKLQVGDEVRLICKPTTAQTCVMKTIVQFFLMV